jgi:uncharacterized protein (DUF302 family)
VIARFADVPGFEGPGIQRLREHVVVGESDIPARVITQRSVMGFDETVSRLVSTIESAGLRVFDVIDHAAAATDVGLSLPPTTVVVFGSPAAGTPLMVDHPMLALELPLRILISQDEHRVVHLSYLDPRQLASAFGVAAEKASVLAGPARMIEQADLGEPQPARS